MIVQFTLYLYHDKQIDIFYQHKKTRSENRPGFFICHESNVTGLEVDLPL